jgi:hypothetical protein
MSSARSVIFCRSGPPWQIARAVPIPTLPIDRRARLALTTVEGKPAAVLVRTFCKYLLPESLLWFLNIKKRTGLVLLSY